MSELIKTGSWVEIHQVILPAGERAPQVPEDTQKVPLELRTRGFLVKDGKVGEEVEIKTFTDRTLKGILKDPTPSYEHKFGCPVPELLQVGEELRKMVADRGGNK